MAEGKLRDMGCGRFESAHRTAVSVLLAGHVLCCALVVAPLQLLCHCLIREVVSGGPSNQGAGEESPSTWSVFLRQLPRKPAPRGAVPWVMPGRRPSMLVRLGCENLGCDVVGEGADLQCSSKTNPGGGADALTVLLAARWSSFSSFSGRRSKEGTEILFRFDSLHSVAVSTRCRTHTKANIVGAISSLKSHGSAHGIAMTTRICVTAHLLDYALTRTTDDEHWHQRQGRDHTIRVHAGRLTRLMTDFWWMRITTACCLTGLSADDLEIGFFCKSKGLLRTRVP